MLNVRQKIIKVQKRFCLISEFTLNPDLQIRVRYNFHISGLIRPRSMGFDPLEIVIDHNLISRILTEGSDFLKRFIVQLKSCKTIPVIVNLIFQSQ